MKRLKVIGAGSIGNHLSHAARCLDWSVVLCDIDGEALKRTREDIYPNRYGIWDESIELCLSDDAPTGGFDFIFIGTPPDHHLERAISAMAEKPSAVLVEKPLCPPDLEGAQALFDASRDQGVPVFCGYDHAVSAGTETVVAALRAGRLGEALTLDVEFREHWAGIFDAHPWLDGPSDTYLGYWRRGGGALGEHSHALNLWQRYALELGQGRVSKVSAVLDYVEDGAVSYDRIALLNLTTETGFCGRVVQDVVTQPPKKRTYIQGSDCHIEWHNNLKPGTESIFVVTPDGERQSQEITKTRPDDFIAELRHLEATMSSGNPSASPISLDRALETMLVIAAAHKSAQSGRSVKIDYDKGFSIKALDT
jgi:predicted dehydrogenase